MTIVQRQTTVPACCLCRCRLIRLLQRQNVSNLSCRDATERRARRCYDLGWHRDRPYPPRCDTRPQACLSDLTLQPIKGRRSSVEREWMVIQPTTPSVPRRLARQCLWRSSSTGRAKLVDGIGPLFSFALPDRLPCCSALLCDEMLLSLQAHKSAAGSRLAGGGRLGL